MNDISSNKIREDILKELLNIYVGQAASLLSDMTDKKINLSIPEVKLLGPENNDKYQLKSFPEFLKGALMISSMKFENELNGKAELIFPIKHIKSLISICSGEMAEINSLSYNNFTDTDFDVIKELGNIILNSVIGGIGNLLDIRINYSMPEIRVYDTIEFKKNIIYHKDKYYLIMYVDFSVDETDIIGALLISFSVKSMSDVLEKIDKMREETYE